MHVPRNTVFAWPRRWACCLLHILAVSNAWGQTIVPPGEGSLMKAVFEVKPGEVLQLAGGGEYTHSAKVGAVLGKSLVIEVKPGSTRKAVIRLSESADTALTYHFFMIKDGASLTLRGIEATGLSKGARVARTLLNFDGLPDPTQSRIGTIRVENCSFHDFKDNVFHGMKDSSARGLHQDSLIIDNTLAYNADGFIQFKHISLHYLKLTNSTMYNLGTLALKIGREGYRSTKISPAGIIDHCTFDNMGGEHGHIQVDDAYSALVISNSIITNIHDSTIQPAVYFKNPHLEASVSLKSICFWKTGRMTAVATAPYWPGYVFKDTVTLDPLFRDPARGDFTLPAGSRLRSFGTDGGAIGDPRWTSGTVRLARPWLYRGVQGTSSSSATMPSGMGGAYDARGGQITRTAAGPSRGAYFRIATESNPGCDPRLISAPHR